MIDLEKLDTRRTEEVQDIVDRMPTKGPRMVLYIVLGMVAIMFILGYVIEYPEVVSGTVTITMGKAPVKLVAKSSGRLLLLENVARQKVNSGKIVAIIDNTTNLKDFLFIDSIMNTFRLSEKDTIFYYFPDNLNLGELNGRYYSFIDTYRQYFDFKTDNVYELNEEACKIKRSSIKQSLAFNENQLELRRKQLDFYKREVSRDSFRLELGDYSQRALDKTQNAYDNMQESYNTLLASISQLKYTLQELNNQLSLIGVEKRDYENNLLISLRAAYNALNASIKEWKDRYAFIAPFEGTVEFLNFWKENDFVIAGTEMFTVIPDKSPVLGHLLLPSIGAGKVKRGQDVSIKLHDFPYMQYGTIKGNVQSISLVAHRTAEQAESSVDTYLVTIDLPEGFTTKFGSVLEFRYETKGIADIKTEKRRLIQRLFDNLKYRIS